MTAMLLCVALTTLSLGVAALLTRGPGTCSYDPLFLEGTCSAPYADPAAKLIKDAFLSLAKADCELANPCDFPHHSPRDSEEYDFIVVGAGSAGCVVAKRLTEVSKWTVLLLEAGSDQPKTCMVPGLSQYLRDTHVDWQFKTEPGEPICLGSEGSQCKWPRGKVLGGTSSINSMAYVRGSRKDYDGWESKGNVGWGYDSILHYFKKSEDMRSKDLKNTEDFLLYHRTGGPLKIEDYNSKNYNELIELMKAGFAELGYPYNPDCNGRSQSGFCKLRGTLEAGRRCSTATFLTPLKERDNFRLSKRSLVTKVLIDEISKVAYGVEFLNEEGDLVRVLARKEVILSGGSVNSPQILMLSGVGPRQHLVEQGITVISDLPVGENLQDHYFILGFMMTLNNFEVPEENSTKSIINFLLKDTENSFSVIPYNLAMTLSPGETDYPDVHVSFTFSNKNSSKLLKSLSILGYNDEVKKGFLDVNKNSSTLFLEPSLFNAKSKGNIRLRSKDARQHPVIKAGYFSNPRDFDLLIDAIRILRRLSDTDPFRSLGATFHHVPLRRCSKYPQDSRPYWECYMRHMVITGAHPVGTCSMGPSDSPDAVVDPRLLVHGVDHLRVIDASVMPCVPRANTNAPTIMIAEKGADFIKESWLHNEEYNLFVD